MSTNLVVVRYSVMSMKYQDEKNELTEILQYFNWYIEYWTSNKFQPLQFS